MTLWLKSATLQLCNLTNYQRRPQLMRLIGVLTEGVMLAYVGAGITLTLVLLTIIVMTVLMTVLERGVYSNKPLHRLQLGPRVRR